MSLVPPVQPGSSYAATGTRPEPPAIVGNGGGHGVASAAAISEAAIQAATLDPLMAALTEALGAAAARQNGLAPLFADLEALVARADVPETVRNAAQTLLDLRLPDTALEGGSLRQAVSRSGLFVEAVQARGLTPDINIKSALQSLRGALQGLLDKGLLDKGLLDKGLLDKGLLDKGLLDKGLLDNGLLNVDKGLLDVDSGPAAVNAVPLSTPVRGATPAASPPLPLPSSSPAPASPVDAGVRQAATVVLTETEGLLATTPGSSPVRTAGLPVLSANLNTLLAQPDLPEAVRNAGQALLSLRSVPAPDGVSRQTPGPSGLPLQALLPDTAMTDTAMTDAVIKVALQNLRDTLKGFLGVDSAPADKRAAPLPPPFRGALPVAQPPVPASIVDTGLRQAATKVLSEADAAIARHVMLQIASLPASQQPSHPPDDHTQRLVCDIPIATPQGTMIVQIQIEREAPQREFQPPVWSVRFAVDIEPIGPVRARVAQIGGRTSVTLVAENPLGAAALQKDIGALKAALSQAELEPGDLHCLSHDQTKVTAPQGQFVNRAS